MSVVTKPGRAMQFLWNIPSCFPFHFMLGWPQNHNLFFFFGHAALVGSPLQSRSDSYFHYVRGSTTHYSTRVSCLVSILIQTLTWYNYWIAPFCHKVYTKLPPPPYASESLVPTLIRPYYITKVNCFVPVHIIVKLWPWYSHWITAVVPLSTLKWALLYRNHHWIEMMKDV